MAHLPVLGVERRLAGTTRSQWGVSKAPIETEAIDAARDEMVFRHGLLEGMRALKQAGGLADLFEER
jgi:hypothetical protein